MKRILAMMLVLCILATHIPMLAMSSEIVSSGTIGDGENELTWTQTEDGVLTISGNGAMRDYILDYSKPPWGGSVKIKKIVIEEGVTRIGDYAFAWLKCAKSVSLPNSLLSIGDGAFYRCEELADIQLPPNLEEMGFDVFRECFALKEISIPDGVTAIEGKSFYLCGALQKVDLPDQLYSIGPEAFYSAAVENIDFPDTVAFISSYAFSGCNIKKINIPDALTRISDHAFNGCDFESLVIPDGVTTIDTTAFGGCSALVSVVLPESLQVLGDKAFASCTSLETIVLPEKTFSLGNDVFAKCQNLHELSFTGDPPLFSENAFRDFTGIVRYPSDNSNWTTEIMQNYGGKIVWVDDTHVHQLITITVEPTCTQEGYTEDTCVGCGAVIVRERVEILGHDMTDATCTEPKKCKRAGCNETNGVPRGHTWDNAAVTPRTCVVCGFIDDHMHEYTSEVTEPRCVTEGYTTHYCVVCDYAYADNYKEPLGHDMTEPTCVERSTCRREGCRHAEGYALGHTWIESCDPTRLCTVCGYTEETGGHNWDNSNSDARYCYTCGRVEGGYLLDLTEIDGEIWVDGKYKTNGYYNGFRYAIIRTADAKTLVTYSYHNLINQDRHTQYPDSMKVWLLSLEGDTYKATYVKEFDNLLQYSGSSIRISGKKGIRMITSIEKEKRNALTGSGLAGYKLVEYGTLLAWDKELKDRNPLILGQSYTKSNYAYKKGVADPIFKDTGKLIQYTNVLVGFSNEQCSDDIAMRPYIILENDAGNQITIYGGIVYRSIGYIAYQNRNAFKPDTAAYEYVWKIIWSVYGTKYDSEYKG